MSRLLAIGLVLAGWVMAGPAQAHPPYGLVTDQSGNAYFSDLETVWRLAADGDLSVFRPAVPGRHVHELAIGPGGHVEGDENRYDPQTQRFYSGLWQRALAGEEQSIVPLSENPPRGAGVWQDAGGNRYVTEWVSSDDRRTALIQRSRSGVVKVLYDAGAGVARRAPASVASVGGMAFAADGFLYFADGSVLRRLNPDGAVETVYVGGAPSSLRGIAVTPDGRLLAADMESRTVIEIGADGASSILYHGSSGWIPTAVALAGQRLLVLEANADHHEYVRRVRLVELRNGVATVVASPPFADVDQTSLEVPPAGPGSLSRGQILLGGIAATAVLAAAWFVMRKKT
jgi:DNA-binding beta-propeller fold protein YncE